MTNYSNEFLERTIKVWQPYSKEPLTLDDAREITENMVNFFKLLMETDRKHNITGEFPSQ